MPPTKATETTTDPSEPTGVNAIDPGRPYSMAEVARLLTVSYSTVAKAVVRGDLASVQVFGRRKVLGQALLDHMGHIPTRPEDSPSARKRRAAEAAARTAAILRRPGRATRSPR